jgi:Uncharacterized protein conserved in bacteria (DUF2171)
MWNQPPPQTPFDGEAGLGMAAEYKLQPCRAGTFIAELGHGIHSLTVDENAGTSRQTLNVTDTGALPVSIRGRQMTEIKEHMEVIGADGVHLGTVDKFEGNRIKLTTSASR